jgi:hypothetical protein
VIEMERAASQAPRREDGERITPGPSKLGRGLRHDSALARAPNTPPRAPIRRVPPATGTQRDAP